MSTSEDHELERLSEERASQRLAEAGPLRMVEMTRRDGASITVAEAEVWSYEMTGWKVVE